MVTSGGKISRALAAVACLSALGACAVSGVPAWAATPPDAIRVGGPSLPGDSKVAIVGSRAPMAGRAFRVLDAHGATVLRGRLHRAVGSPAPWRNAATADLSAVRAEGAFRVVVGRLRSRAWIVTVSGSTALIPLLLRFFAANSDGNEPSPEHGPAHLHDAVVAAGPHGGQHFDLTGGWMDAGDMIHFAKTTAYAASALQLAARIDPANAAALNRAADVGIRWLVKAHPAPDLFIQQVGDERDHDVGYRDPALDDRSSLPGIGTRLAYAGIGKDVGGKVATALALAAVRNPSPVREQLLHLAEQWYAAGQAGPGAAPRPQGLVGGYFYGNDEENGGEDDLGAAAVMLWRATGESQKLIDAVHYLGHVPPDPLSWADTAMFGFADLCGGLGLPAVPDAAARQLACGKLRTAALAVETAGREFAFPVYGDYGWGTTATTEGAAAVAGLAARARVINDGRAVADGGRDWILGRNQWGVSFVVGYGPGAPLHPQHWAATLGAGRPVGAVVGGPAPRSTVLEQKGSFTFHHHSPFDSPDTIYEDNAEDYVTSEPALDYNAATILNLAIAG
jgi:hypothetical protein